MVPTPIALGMNLCDYVIVEERTKKVSLIGTFTGMSGDRFPFTARPFSIHAVLTEGAGSGTIQLEVVRLDTGEVVYTHRGGIFFPDVLQEVICHVRLQQCEFPTPANYQFTLLIDGEWVAQRRLRVYQHPEAT
jgi:hypothetical protein